MNILVTTDKNYLQYAYVMLVSLLENNGNSHINLYYIHHDLDSTSINRFKNYFSKYDMTVTFLKYDFSQLEGLKTIHHINQATYLRIISPDILPEKINRILYLDADIIVTKSLTDLYNTDLGDCFFGAVEDDDPVNERHIALNIPSEYGYFNSGVMLIDLEKFRSNLVSERVLDYAFRHGDKIVWLDQDALNAVLYDKCLALHPRWNVSGTVVRHVTDKSYPFSEEMIEAVAQPAVIHYNGGVLTLGLLRDHPFGEIYWHYLKKTPYRYSQPLENWYKRNRLKFREKIASLIRELVLRLPKQVQNALPHALMRKIRIAVSKNS